MSQSNESHHEKKTVEGLYYLFRDNKGADQLRGHRASDLRLLKACFLMTRRKWFSHLSFVGKGFSADLDFGSAVLFD